MLVWSKSFGGQQAHLAPRSCGEQSRERVNPMHTHFIVVIGQLVSLLG